MQLLAFVDPLYVLSGLCVGVLVGMTGVGGGSLMTPLLILLFGIHPATAVGTDLLFAALTKTAGTLAYGAARTIEWRIVGLLAAGSVPGTVVTLVALSMIDLDGPTATKILTAVLAGVLLVTSMFLLCAKSMRIHAAGWRHAFDTSKACALTIGLGFTMGVLVSATSIGAGAIGVTMLLLLHPKMRTARIVGSDIAHAVPLTFIAGVGHWALGSVDWPLLGTLLVGSIPGIMVGSYLGTRAPDGTVRTALAVVLMAVAVKLLI
jgi:uncharacterized membrane protein YfcA